MSQQQHIVALAHAANLDHATGFYCIISLQNGIVNVVSNLD